MGLARISPSTSCSLSHAPPRSFLALRILISSLVPFKADDVVDDDDDDDDGDADEAASALAKAAAATADKAAKLDPVFDDRPSGPCC